MNFMNIDNPQNIHHESTERRYDFEISYKSYLWLKLESQMKIDQYEGRLMAHTAILRITTHSITFSNWNLKTCPKNSRSPTIRISFVILWDWWKIWNVFMGHKKSTFKNKLQHSVTFMQIIWRYTDTLHDYQKSCISTSLLRFWGRPFACTSFLIGGH